MNSKELIEKTTALWSLLQKKLEEIKREKNIELEYAQYALMESDTAVRTIKKWVVTHHFDCWEDEITFFKNLKPKFMAKFTYYSRMVSILSSMPATSTKFKKKFYEEEFERLQFFFLEHRDFLSYYRKKSTYLDLKYFVRYKYDLDLNLAPDYHNYDEKFSTTHDLLVSAILANDEYAIFLKSKMRDLKEIYGKEIKSENKLHWSASKVALTELIFALHQTNCFNGGTADLSETVKWFENKLSIDLGNYHKTINEVRARKTPQAKFLLLLTENLQNYFEE